MKKLGQHFLKNKAVLDTIINALDLQSGDRVIEIGPGHGELTVPLLAAAANLDCKVIVVEKDHLLMEELRELQKETGEERLKIVEGDALKLLPQAPQSATHKIVGNIPYYITGKLLRVISELEVKPTMTVIMIQKEVAERICAVPPEMNRLAASVQFWADAEIIASVPRKDFTPPPEVDSAVIVLKTKRTGEELGVTIDPELYYKTVRGVFAQPRKNLINNIFEMMGKTIPKPEIVTVLTNMAIDPEARPQNLSVEEIIGIAQAFS